MPITTPPTRAAQGIALPPRLAGDQARRILVVDDTQFLGIGLERALRSAGFECHCVTGGARALEMLGRQSFDVVLTDLRMPEMSGEELLAALQRKWPGVPCVVVTAYATREAITCVARIPNVAGVLVKPIEYNKLFTVLSKVLSQSTGQAMP